MLKVGVFGVGHLGKFHLNNWKQIPTVKTLLSKGSSEKSKDQLSEREESQKSEGSLLEKSTGVY